MQVLVLLASYASQERQWNEKEVIISKNNYVKNIIGKMNRLLCAMCRQEMTIMLYYEREEETAILHLKFASIGRN